MTTVKSKFRRTTQEQLQFYIRFCNQHPEIHSRVSGVQATYDNKNLWRELVANLNALRGPTRTVVKWKENLSQRKNQIRCRARKEKEARLKAEGADLLEPDQTQIYYRYKYDEEPKLPDNVPGNVNVSPCIEGLNLQNATIINGGDLDGNFLSEIKIETDEEKDIPKESLFDPARVPKTPLATLSPPPIASTPPAPIVTATRKKVTLETIHKTLLEGMERRRVAEERTAELQLQTVTVLQHLSQSLLSISDSLSKLNKKLDKL